MLFTTVLSLNWLFIDGCLFIIICFGGCQWFNLCGRGFLIHTHTLMGGGVTLLSFSRCLFLLKLQDLGWPAGGGGERGPNHPKMVAPGLGLKSSLLVLLFFCFLFSFSPLTGRTAFCFGSFFTSYTYITCMHTFHTSLLHPYHIQLTKHTPYLLEPFIL